MNINSVMVAVMLCSVVTFMGNAGDTSANSNNDSLFSRRLSDGSMLILKKESHVEVKQAPAGRPPGSPSGSAYVTTENIVDHYCLTKTTKNSSETVWEKTITNIKGVESGIGPAFVFWDAEISDDRLYIIYSAKLYAHLDILSKQVSGDWKKVASHEMKDRLRCLGVARFSHNLDPFGVRYMDEDGYVEEWVIRNNALCKGSTDLHLQFPVRHVVLDAGTLFGIDTTTLGQSDRVHLITVPVVDSKSRDTYPLIIGSYPYWWCVENSVCYFMTSQGMPNTSEIERTRHSQHPLSHPLVFPQIRNNQGQLSPSSLGVMSNKDAYALMFRLNYYFDISVNQRKYICLYTLDGNEIAMWRRSLRDSAERLAEYERVFMQETSAKGPFRMMRFAGHDYLLDVLGDLYRIQEHGIKKVGYIECWHQNNKPETARHYVLFYDAAADGSRLLVLNEGRLEMARIRMNSEAEEGQLKPVDIPLAIEKTLLELAERMWSDVTKPKKVKEN